MFNGDRARKLTLVEYGFRLPSALDNRPLMFDEFLALTPRAMFVSATPGELELRLSEGVVVEQIIRPTGLIDPEIEVRPVRGQVDDLLERDPHARAAAASACSSRRSPSGWPRISPTISSRSGVRVRYMHSDIDAIERMEIVRGLRLGEFDVLVGINLLREGLDLPEVSLVAILDADQEGFLRSDRSLIQTVGRAARHVQRPGDLLRRPDHRLDAALHRGDEPPPRDAARVQRGARHHADVASSRASTRCVHHARRRRARPRSREEGRASRRAATR